MQAPLPPREAERLEALRRYEILDTLPEQQFDDITLLASRICDTPIAMISLIDENRQWFKSRIGMTASETSRDIAFCAHGILQPGVFVVNDAQADERFAANPLVTGDPGIRFYAGAPLITADGHALGMLCVNDAVPRELSLDQMEALRALSRQVVAQLELRRSLAELRKLAVQLTQAEAELQWKTVFLEAQVNSSADGVLVVNEQGKMLLQNQRMTDLWKIPPHIAEEKGDEHRLRWVASMTKNPEQFVAKVLHLYAHPDQISQDEIELRDGMMLDRYSSPVRGKDGKYFGRIWTFRDITERKRAEAKMRESEERFSGAFEHAPIGVALVAPDGRWLKVNRALCDLVGYSEAELLVRTFQDITHPGDLEADLENVRQLLAGEINSYQMEKRYVHQRGHLVTALLHVSLVRDGQGQARYFISQIKDITARKQTEDALRESNEKFHLLADNITDAFWIRSPDMRELYYISPAFERIWGRSVASLYANPSQWADFILPADRERVLAVFAALTQDAPSLDLEYRIVRPDGEIRWVHVRGFQVRNSADELIRHIGIVTDITQQHQAAESLRTSLEEFRTLSESMPQIVWITRPDGGNVYFNQQWMDYTGLTGEESRGHGWNKPFHPEDRQRAWDAWQHAVATADTYSLECRLRRADGLYRWWLIRGVPVRDATGNILKWFGTCTDIHDLKEAEGKVAYERDQLRALIDASPDPIYFKDVRSRFVLVSRSKVRNAIARVPDLRATRAARGLPPEVPEAELLTGLTDFDTYRDDDASLAYEDEQHIVRTGEPMIGKLEQQTLLDGTVRWALTSKIPWRDRDGKIIGTFGISKDITDLKETEEKLEQVNRRMLETSRQAGMAEFATGILHNVGNVLNSVNVASICVADSLRGPAAANLSKVVVLLREHENDLGAFLTSDPRGQLLPGFLAHLAEHLAGEQAGALKELAQLQGDIEHIRDMVTTQQRLARTSGGTETVHVTGLVEDALRMSFSGGARHDIDVRNECQGVPPITVEKHKVLQILVNLVRNARQACEASGRLEKQVGVHTTHGPGHVRIAVRDNGVGIPPENLPRIFTHGFTTKRDGHGFGLYGAAQAAQEMGGSLTVHSDGAGYGATFVLELPREPAAPAA